MEAGTVMWILAIVALAIFGGALFWLVGTDLTGRLMRCPETGAVTLVRAVPAPGGKGEAPGIAVSQCDLWPERKNCAQGCLSRYRETAPGMQVNLNALRPFEPQ